MERVINIIIDKGNNNNIGFIGLLTVVLITLKLLNLVGFSWWIVLSPILITLIIIMILLIILILIILFN